MPQNAMNAPGRRRFLACATALSGAGMLGCPRSAAAEPALDTTRVRMPATPGSSAS
jgi:hypothetical protein